MEEQLEATERAAGGLTLAADPSLAGPLSPVLPQPIRGPLMQPRWLKDALDSIDLDLRVRIAALTDRQLREVVTEAWETVYFEKAEIQTRMGNPGLLGDKSAVRFRAAEQYPGITNRQRQKVSANGAQETSDKGNLELLRGKEFVTVLTACRFGGVKQCAIQRAIAKGSLEVVGTRQNR